MEYDYYNPDCIYHTGYNKLTRRYRDLGIYDVEHMCKEAWCYVMDDFGDAVPYKGHWHYSPFLCQVY
jgi:hypothetical protein